jgi:chemotaxis protein MotB
MLRPTRERHQNQEPADNLNRWVISYADFITLLFVFFTVMYAISAINVNKYKIFSTSVGTAFGVSADMIHNRAPANENEVLLKSLVEHRDAKLLEQARKRQQAMQDIVKSLNQIMAPLVKSGMVSVTETARGVVLEIKASVLFDQGNADLHSASIAALSDVAKTLEDSEQAIEIEGYSDDAPIKTARFPSNWELSSARASSVARLFIDQGVAASRLTVVGGAANSPVAPNDTPEGRARNRRITVTILAPEVEHAATAQETD